MKGIRSIATIIGLFLAPIAFAQNGPSKGGAGMIEPLPKDLETQLALSALPSKLRAEATVYVLNPTEGFEVAKKGTNGFYAFVARTGDDAMQGSWPLTKYPEDVLYPVSFDSAGSKANMRSFFDIAELQAKGTEPELAKKIIQERYRTGYYKAPSESGCSYMLSPILRTYINPDQGDEIVTASVPHIMCYAPNVSTREVGVTPTPEEVHDFGQHGYWAQTPYPFVIHQGPHGYMVHVRGQVERAAIDGSYGEMLARLCRIRPAWCLSQEQVKAESVQKGGK